VPGTATDDGARQAAFGGDPEHVDAIRTPPHADAANHARWETVTPVENVDLFVVPADETGPRSHPNRLIARLAARRDGIEVVADKISFRPGPAAQALPIEAPETTPKRRYPELFLSSALGCQ
jgi:hypothetical protein